MKTFDLRLIRYYTSDVQSAEPTLETELFYPAYREAFLSIIRRRGQAFDEIQGKTPVRHPLADDDLNAAGGSWPLNGSRI